MNMTRIQTASPEAVYLHIPFCTNKCHYCDFNSYVLKGQPVMEYLAALEREMERTALATPPGAIDTIFVGGGTPTVLLPEQMAVFLRMVETYFPNRSGAFEFTMEANPGTTDAEKLAAMKEGGVNRISFGVQSFDPSLLTAIGRIHNVDDVYRSIANARAAGFGNLSIDLMFGLPGQTVETLNRSIDAALALDLQHYSIYGLKVEENTLFHKLYQRNELPLPSEDDEVEMYALIMRRLREAGYRQYEISNFARTGRESRHNITYWRNRGYYGLGAGAHGYHGGERHVNIKGIQPYIDAAQNGLPRMEQFAVSREEAMEDFMMVGLRMLDGVDAAEFARQFDGAALEEVFAPVLESLTGRGLLVRSDSGGYRLSENGIMVGNEIFGAFVGYFA